MKKSILSSILTCVAFSTTTYAFPVEINSKTVYGVQMPAFGQTDSQMVMFKDKSEGSGTTYFKVDVKPSFTTNRFDGRIVEQCDLSSCKPVTGWIVDPIDNSYGIKVDEPTIRKGSILAATMMNGINSKLKDNNVSTEMQKFYDKLQREMIPTMTLKADTQAKLIVNYDVNTSFGYCNTMNHSFNGIYNVIDDTLILKSENHSDSCLNHTPKEIQETITTDIYLFLMSYKQFKGDSAYIQLYSKALLSNAKTVDDLKDIAIKLEKQPSN